jgi:3alpha(or 20beta)-hydroxysteroid dehydrogenase
VINTSSVGGLHASPNMTPCVASKHAVVGLTKTVAVKAAQYGVRVNSIHPAAVNTRMMRSLEEGYSPGSPEDARARFEQALPLGRYAEPIDVARLVVFLASDDSTFISRAQYRVDGGQGAL